MITDSETNFLYLADSLKKEKYSDFLTRFKIVLEENSIPYDFLSSTKDIWAVDYMPIQISAVRFVKFDYNPDYLQNKTQRKTISDGDSICKTTGRTAKQSKLIVDGGNVIRSTDKIIMCDKVFKENSNLSEKELIKQLKDDFEIEKLYFVPWDKSDYIGHADGMVRFVDSNTVVINDYSREKPEYQRAFRMALHNAGLDWKEIPYNPYDNKPYTSARGIYLNYLQMEKTIIVPTFQREKEDEEAITKLREIFKGKNIIKLESNVIADRGGILNCITWNIRTDKEKNGR